MRVLVVTGSRMLGNTPQDKRAILNEILAVEQDEGVFDGLIHGDARGVDRTVADWFVSQGRVVMAYPAKWKVSRNTRSEDVRYRIDGSSYDAGAGRRRNVVMCDTALALEKRGDAVLVMAFQRDDSRGTQHMIDTCRQAGLEVRVFKF